MPPTKKRSQTLADAIREARIQTGRSLRDVARAIRMSPTYLCHVETGQAAAPTEKRLRALAAELHADADLWILMSGRVPEDVVEILQRYPLLLGEIRARGEAYTHLGDAGKGVSRQLPHLGDAGHGECEVALAGLVEWMQRLADRLRRVRVCCGDWARVTGKSVTWHNASPCAVFLDPPYADTAGRDGNPYSTDSLSVAHKVREWAIEEGERRDMRIALCGYEGEHEMPDSWECVAWKTHGGYAQQGNGAGKENAHRERIWFSPHCVRPVKHRSLFEGDA